LTIDKQRQIMYNNIAIAEDFRCVMCGSIHHIQTVARILILSAVIRVYYVYFTLNKPFCQ